MKFIDLTREINNETQVCPCDKVPVVENYATTEEEGVNVKFMKMGTHTSTHIDAPYHISKSGKTLNDFPVERFIGQESCLTSAIRETSTRLRGRISWPMRMN